MATSVNQILRFYVMFSQEGERMTTEFSFDYFSSSFGVVHSSLVKEQTASILQVKQIGIIAKELQKREVIFGNVVFFDTFYYLFQLLLFISYLFLAHNSKSYFYRNTANLLSTTTVMRERRYSKRVEGSG